MNLLQRIFGREPKPQSEEEKILQELEVNIDGLDAPPYVKYRLKEAARFAKIGNSWEYENTLKKVNQRFISREYFAGIRRLQKITDVQSVFYWLANAEKKAREGDLEYVSALKMVERRAARESNPEVSQRIAEISLLFEASKWSKVPSHLETLLKEALQKINSGEPQLNVDFSLNKAEEYAQVLGYTLRPKE